MEPKYVDFFSQCQGRKLNKIDFKLLYKATRDGDKANDIVGKLKGKRNLLYFVRSANGRSFGLY